MTLSSDTLVATVSMLSLLLVHEISEALTPLNSVTISFTTYLDFCLF